MVLAVEEDTTEDIWRPLLYFKVTRIQNPHNCEWLLLEYMQTRVYYNPYMDTGLILVSM